MLITIYKHSPLHESLPNNLLEAAYSRYTGITGDWQILHSESSSELERARHHLLGAESAGDGTARLADQEYRLARQMEFGMRIARMENRPPPSSVPAEKRNDIIATHKNGIIVDLAINNIMLLSPARSNYHTQVKAAENNPALGELASRWIMDLTRIHQEFRDTVYNSWTEVMETFGPDQLKRATLRQIIKDEHPGFHHEDICLIADAADISSPTRVARRGVRSLLKQFAP